MKTTLTLLLLFLSAFVLQAQVKITGKVYDAENGGPLPGVNIIESGTANGTISDFDGNFTLSVRNRESRITFSFVGYNTQEIVVADQTVIEVRLAPETISLNEVMVVGYGTQKKSVVTGSIAKIDQDELSKSTDTRIEQALQGRTSGVMIMNNSGQPGDNLSIRIRGTGTNNDPDPLFIIDGLPMEKEGLDYLNANDIASIEVLKDASSCSIYGTRGANGVVIITTKQGKKNGRFTVSYDGYYGFQNPWKKMDLLNAQQYMDIINEAGVNDKRTNPYFSQAMMDTINWSTDWQDEMYYYNAPKTNHTFSFNGGSENSTFSSSLSYFGQDGIVAEGKSNFNRLTYRLNTTHDFGKLTIGSNMNVVNIKTKGIDGNTQYGTGINQALNIQPIVPVTYSNGAYATPSDFGVGLQEITNPVALLEIINSKTNTNKVLGNVNATYEIIEGLKFRTDFGGEVAVVEWKSFTPVYFIDTNHQNDSTNYMGQSTTKYVRWNWDNTLTYTKSFGNHNLVALVGMTRFKEYSEGTWIEMRNLIFNDLDHAYLDNSQSTTARASGGYGEHTLASLFARLNYNYNEKYLFEGVVRRDGSSRFGSDNKYGIFPAFSAGWVISKEDFFPQLGAISFAKLRASWGQNGNEKIPDFAYTSTMSSSLIYYFGTDQTPYYGIQPSRYPNSALKWETSQQFDAGLDLALLNNKLSFLFNFYDKRTKDWLIDAPAMTMIGNTRPYVNGGEVKNTGFEIELGYKERFSNNLSFSVSMNGSTNKSKVLSINNVDGKLYGSEGIKGQGAVLLAEEGSPLGYFWGYETSGVFQTVEEIANYPAQKNAKVGDLIFVDQDTSGTLNDDDKVYLGTPYPKLILGLNLTLEWKGFDVYMFWYSALGHQIWRANRRDDLKYSNFSTDVLNRWHGEGTSYDYPRVTISDPNGSWKKPSDFYVEDADFLRLKSVTLGYTLPKTLTSFLKVQKIRIYVSGENLLTFTKYSGLDVEVGGGPLGLGIDYGVYPQAKTVLGGLSITF
ncbi:MAG: SusC/RagA family TonB-linked outer membrane protein [Bacteroidota bacterium]